MLTSLYCYCYDSRFSGCTIPLVCVFCGSRLNQKFTVAHLFILTSTSHAKSKSKPDNCQPKPLPPLTVYYTNVGGLRVNFTDLEAFMLKNNPDIFALCETNLHDDIQDSDFQLPDRMLGICIRAIFRLLERLFLRMKNSLRCFHLALLHSTTVFCG